MPMFQFAVLKTNHVWKDPKFQNIELGNCYGVVRGNKKQFCA